MSGLNATTLLSVVDVMQIQGKLPNFVTGITQASQLIEPGFVFFARSGSKCNGLDFAEDAARSGAALIITALPLPPKLPLPAVRVIDERLSLVKLAHLIYNYPSKSLILIGVTGTNGKTSSVHLIRSIVEASGAKCGMLSTIGYWTGARFVAPQLTTPDIDRICALLSEMVEAGCRYVVMEVSSHALDQGRVEGLEYKVAAFSNLSLDHIDYHSTFEAYGNAKLKLIDMQPQDSVTVVNLGDAWGKRFAQTAKGRLITFKKIDDDDDDDVIMKLRTARCDGSGGEYRLKGLGTEFTVKTPLVGEFQGENIALAAAVALGLGFDSQTIIHGIEALKCVPGRMEAISAGQPFTVVVDFCHTPDALQRALTSLRNLRPRTLAVMFGCGGDRDKTKRPKMGFIAAQVADKVIITSDNPRSEPPQAICDEIYAGVPVELHSKVRIIPDRRQAIFQIISEAKAGDIIILAGKGAETTLEAQSVKTPFDDRLTARETLIQYNAKANANVHNK